MSSKESFDEVICLLIGLSLIQLEVIYKSGFLIYTFHFSFSFDLICLVNLLYIFLLAHIYAQKFVLAITLIQACLKAVFPIFYIIILMPEWGVPSGNSRPEPRRVEDASQIRD